MSLTPQQRNVRAALGTIVHELDGGEGTIVFVTRGYFDITLSSTVVAVEPDGTVAGWKISHSWTQDGPGVQWVHAEPTHYDLAARSGSSPGAELAIRRTEGRPRWHVAAIAWARAKYIDRDVYDAPHALAVALDAIYGPDIPTDQRAPAGRKHGG